MAMENIAQIQKMLEEAEIEAECTDMRYSSEEVWEAMNQR